VNTSRRSFLRHVFTCASAVLFYQKTSEAKASENETMFDVQHTEKKWKDILTPEQFHVLREQGTERADSSPLNTEKRPGQYFCAACDLPLFSSTTKYESGTGWPSFWEPLPDAVRTRKDHGFFMSRIEVHCRRCGGHLGHVFDDGPQPTGKRYCINGVALKFKSDVE
jgi:peptide-methionine (R)-S-oxide reductase